MQQRPSRRRVLAGVLRAVGGACGGAVAVPWLSGCSDEPEGPDPVTLLVRRAAARERDLLARYALTARRHPGLAAALEVPRANHEAHLAALVGRRKARATRAPGATGAGDTGATPDAARTPGQTPAVPASPREALAELVRAERRAAGEAAAEVGKAPPRLRRLIASVGGAEASHAALIATGDGT